MNYLTDHGNAMSRRSPVRFSTLAPALPSAIGVPALAWLSHVEIAVALAVLHVVVVAGFKAAPSLWRVIGPNVAAWCTHFTWRRIDPDSAIKMAKHEHRRVRRALHREAESNSPPDLSVGQ